MTNLAKTVLLASLALSNIVNAAPALPMDPPTVFNDLGVTMQSRVCGEVMGKMALGGVQALQLQFPSSSIPVEQRKPVYEASAQAIVLLAMSSSLSLEDRLKAGKTVQTLELLDPKAQVATALFCQRRITAWIQAKQVDDTLIKKAYAQATILMDRAFASSEH